MQFRLGSIDVQDSSRMLHLARLIELQRQKLREAREDSSDPAGRVERLRVADVLAARPRPDERLPCLLRACPEGHPDHEWLVETHAALQDQEAHGLALQACEAEPGPEAPFTIVATAWRARSEVRLGDVVQAGFVLQRTPDFALRLQPRLYRIRCANGSVTPAGVGEAQAIEPSDLRAAIGEMLSHRKLEAEVARLALAAARTVEDPLEVLQRARVASNREEVLREFASGEDRSYWGLINAVTAVARATRDWHRRIEQEGDAGGILALLESGPDAHRRGQVLRVPRSEEHLALHA